MRRISLVVPTLLLLLVAAAPRGAHAETSSGQCSVEEQGALSKLGGAISKAWTSLKGGAASAPATCDGVDDSRPLPDEVDTIVVGAGPGGGTVAGRLANGGQSVALLDAGSMQVLPITESLAAFAKAAEDDHAGLAYSVTRIPESGFLANYPRLAGLGGASAGAAGIITPFTWADIDGLAKAMGDESLSAASMLQYEKQIENANYDYLGKVEDAVLGSLSPSRHGHGGFQQTSVPPLATLKSSFPDIKQLGQFYGALIGNTADDPESVLKHALGAGDLTDPKVQGSEGLVVLPAATTADGGTRSTVAQYIQSTQCAHPDKLYLKGGAVVDKVLFENGPDGQLRAVGVEYLDGARLGASLDHSPLGTPVRRVVRAKNVVIASSPFGAVGMLERSGVGSARDLDRLGVKPQLVLPGVGRNVGDRLETTVVMQFPHDFKVTSTLEEAENKLTAISDRLAKDPHDKKAAADVKKLFEDYKGILQTNGIPLAMMWKSDPSLKAPDLLFFGFPGDFTNFRKGFSNDLTSQKNLFSVIMLKIDTANDGTAEVSTLDPTVQPKISVGYDVHGADFQAMAKGLVRFNQQIAAKLPDVKVVRGNVTTVDDALKFLSNSDNVFGHHIRGGAAMGPASDPLAVLDSNQKVYGTTNLYVAGTAAWNGSVGPFPIMPIEALSARLGDKILEANATK